MTLADQARCRPALPAPCHRVASVQALQSLDWRVAQAAVWTRGLPIAARASLQRLTEGQAFATSCRLDPRSDNPARLVDGIPAIRPWLGRTPLVGDELARAEIAADLVVLCAAIARITGIWTVRARLSVVDHDACAKFHVDRVALRAVCTYVGCGTEYVPESAVHRAALERAREEGWPPERANRAICRDPTRVVRPDPGDVLLLRGSEFPGAHEPAAVHRSPPGGAAGARRLVLSVDVLSP